MIVSSKKVMLHQMMSSAVGCGPRCNFRTPASDATMASAFKDSSSTSYHQPFLSIFHHGHLRQRFFVIRLTHGEEATRDPPHRSLASARSPVRARTAVAGCEIDCKHLSVAGQGNTGRSAGTNQVRCCSFDSWARCACGISIASHIALLFGQP